MPLTYVVCISMCKLNKIYDVRFLRKGTLLIAQREIPGPLKRHKKYAVFEFVRIKYKSPAGYTEIKVRVDGNEFTSYDDYFRKDMSFDEAFVIQPECMFDEA